MFRSCLLVSLFLSALLISSGCAKKASVAVVEPPAPPAVKAPDPQPEKVASIPVSEPTEVVVPRKVETASKGLERILFEYDSAKLTASAQQLLSNNAEWLKSNPQMNTIIEGHCDERGSDSYNLALGERRARATKDYLTKLGVAPERLSIISYGEEHPVRTGHSEADWRQNRRAEFKTQP